MKQLFILMICIFVFAGVSMVNAIPSILNLNLNSTSLQNTTSENLTCNYNLNDTAVTSIISWYKNGNPTTILNMPFEANSTNALLDYSGNGNNGINNNAFWNSTGGRTGNGCFEFSNSNTYIDLRNPQSMNFTGSKNFSISFWAKVNGNLGTHRPLIQKGDTQYHVKPAISNNWEFCVYDTTWRCIESNNNIVIGNWEHVVTIAKGNALYMYVNGVLQTATINFTSINDDGYNVSLGHDFQNPSRFFNGSLSEITVYNYSLTDAQAKTLFLNRSDVIVSTELSINDNWYCKVTPFSSTMAGTTYTSNNITIISFASYNVIISSTSGNNLVTDNLTCDYNLIGTANKTIINWYKNNKPLMILYLPFESNSTNALKDFSGNGINGTGNNVIWNSTSGYNNSGSFDFNGYSSYINMGNDSRYNLYDNFTVSFWLKLKRGLVAEFPLNTYYRYVTKKDDFNTVTGWDIASGVFNGSNNIGFIGENTAQSNIAFFYFNESSFNWSRWHNFVMTVKNISGNKVNVTLYLDGVYFGSNTNANSIIRGTENLTIGRLAVQPRDYLNGTIDDIRIYNTTLSPQQILNNYNNKTNMIMSNEIKENDTWQCSVTPYSNTIGTTVYSNIITIVSQACDIYVNTIFTGQTIICDIFRVMSNVYVIFNNSILQRNATIMVNNSTIILDNRSVII